MFWGLSRALDLIAEVKIIKEIVPDSEINILLIGSADGRHIFKTLSQLKRHSKELKVNFFLMDRMEMLVRQMLLLAIALEPSDKLGLLEKSRIWMEVYGNTLIRSSTAKYVIQKIFQLRLMASDKQLLEKRMPLVDLSLLRYSDRDCFDEVAKYYQNNKRYGISRAWDGILRTKFEVEYDHRFSYFDLDYGATLIRIPGGHRVCKSEYIHWRNTGIAFTWMETEYSIGNPTLAMGIGSSGGDDLYSLGYWGDMDSGPFFAFGTDSEEKKMLEVRNDVNVRRATDITERNLQRMFHELEHGSPPSDLYAASIDLGLVMMKPGNVDVERDVILDYEPDRTPEEYSSIPVPNCKVFFLPSNAMEIFPTKAKYKEFFDIAFVAQNFFKFLNMDIMSMMKPSGCLVIETKKFVININKDTGCFGKEVRNKLHEFGWKEAKKCHFRKDDHALFRKSSENSGSEISIQNQNATKVGNITDSPGKNEQLSIEDTKVTMSNFTAEASESYNLDNQGNTNLVECQSVINKTKVVSSGINSLTSLEVPEIDCKVDFQKKMEDEESAVVEESCLTISPDEHDSHGAVSEDTKLPEIQVPKSDFSKSSDQEPQVD